MSACPSGQERSLKTGKCINICPIGSARNPATGRCVKNKTAKVATKAATKKVATKAATKATTKKVATKDCLADEEISLKTGKCVKKCPAGSSRNPATGRCVKDKVAKPAKTEKKARVIARVPTPYQSPQVRVPTPYQSPQVRVPTPPPATVFYMNPENLPKPSSSSSLSPIIPMHNKAKVQVPLDIDDVVEIDKEIVIDAEMRKYLKEEQPNLTTPEEMKEYIKEKLREFKNNVITEDESDFADYLTEPMQMDANDICHMTTDDFIKCLEHQDSPYHADYVIAKKYKKKSIKKLLDRVKFYLIVSEGLLIEHVNDEFTLKESLQHLTTEYGMTISPRMAHYVKFFLERGNKKEASNDDDEEERAVSNDSYMSGEYSGDSYGLVGSKNVAPYKKSGRNKGYKKRTSSSW